MDGWRDGGGGGAGQPFVANGKNDLIERVLQCEGATKRPRKVFLVFFCVLCKKKVKKKSRPSLGTCKQLGETFPLSFKCASRSSWDERKTWVFFLQCLVSPFEVPIPLCLCRHWRSTMHHACLDGDHIWQCPQIEPTFFFEIQYSLWFCQTPVL